MTNAALLDTLIITPLIAGLLALVIRQASARRFLVGALAAVMTGALIALYRRVPFIYTPPSAGPLPLEDAMMIAEFLLAAYVLYSGWRLRDRLILGMAALQTALMIWFDFGVRPEVTGPVFVVDWLSFIICLLVSLVGPLIAIYALGYMDEHEAHHPTAHSRQPRFFAILLGFLGAMNALAFANRLPWLYLAWEATTLASFLLISHDGTPEALASGRRALRINVFGGLAMVAGLILAYRTFGTLSLTAITSSVTHSPLALLALALFVLAAFTKAAQLPFQSWLLGAMVAPTPVSALLHSSTMVKAGVYLILRLAPAFRGTHLSLAISLLGAFTFAAASALAFSQTNAKRVLAYSTIANLGLIIACAGVNSPLAIGAALALTFFHGLSKALLFLCVGTIEQRIGSRDIEDMVGLIDRMPTTTIIALIGMASVLLPPFGVLISKWALMEAAARSPLIIGLIAIGSALTLIFWTKWMARLLTSTFEEKLASEPSRISMRLPLVALLSAVAFASVDINQVLTLLIGPAEHSFYGSVALVSYRAGEVVSSYGAFQLLPVFGGLLAIGLAIPYTWRRAKQLPVARPYLCGDNDPADIDAFHGAGGRPQLARVSGVYLTSLLGESVIGKAVNCAAIFGLILMFGVVIK